MNMKVNQEFPPVRNWCRQNVRQTTKDTALNKPIALAQKFWPSRLTLSIAVFIASGGVFSEAAAEEHGEAAQAQASEAEKTGDITTIAPLVITATKRKSTVFKTPLAVSAITKDDLDDTGAADVKDYAKLVPGLSVQDNGPGATRLSMRGIYSTGEATTGLYYEDTPISGFVGASSDGGGKSPDIPTFDVERIEVLRGPQGTLYGASSMAGVVRVIFEKPKLDQYEGSFEQRYETTQGGTPSWRSDVMANVPLIQDKLAARVTLFKSSTGGYIDNIDTGDNNINSYDQRGARLQLRFQPTDNLTIDGSVYDEKSKGLSSGISPGLDMRYATNSQTQPPYKDNTKLYNLTLNWDLDWANLTAVSSYFDRDSAYAVDASYYMQTIAKKAATCKSVYNAGVTCSADVMAAYTEYVDGLTPSVVYYPGTTRNWSNELRLASKENSVLDWTAGLYEEDRRNGLYSEDAMADAGSGAVIMPVELYYRRHISDQLKQQAAFGEVTYHATTKFNLTTGLRYYNYDKTVAGYTDIAQPLFGSTLSPLTSMKAGQSGWLKKINASYQLDPHSMLYATAADGLRPGGANQVIGLDSGLVAYRADSLWNYEAGIKNLWLDGRLSFNADVYQINWKDMQISARTANGAYSFLTNAGRARIRGMELDANYRTHFGLNLGAVFNYTDAILIHDQLNNNISASSTLGRSGDRVPNIARYSGGVAATYRSYINDNLLGMARFDANYVGRSYSTLRPSDPARYAMGNYTLANFRVGIERADQKWNAYLYVKNLFNKYAIVSANGNASFWPEGMAYTAEPRTIGVDVKLNFGG